MATEEDVPLGDSARHYEQQFGDKVRQVQKRGARSPASGSGAGRGAIGGAVIVVIIIVRALISFGNSSSRQSYTPPPPMPQIDFEQMRRDAEARQGPAGAAARSLFHREPWHAGFASRLKGSDVPLPEGLCYRIAQEAGRADLTPGKRVMMFLDGSDRDLVRRGARGQPLQAADIEKLLAALNGPLDKAGFYAEGYFHGIDLPPEALDLATRRALGGPPPGVADIWRLNRLALEAAYPAQIIPARDRLGLDQAARADWEQRARKDLDEARKKNEAAKP